jgi:hypothetical protein
MPRVAWQEVPTLVYYSIEFCGPINLSLCSPGFLVRPSKHLPDCLQFRPYLPLLSIEQSRNYKKNYYKWTNGCACYPGMIG